MKRFILSLVVLMTAVIGANAQNYAGSSKFTDNWSITLQGGVVTPLNDFFTNGSTTPIVVLGVDKYVTPWLGFGVDGRTSIGIGDNYNNKTAFDMVNMSGYVKLNINNLFNFDGTRKTFEPVLYTGVGWGHVNPSDNKNWNIAYTDHVMAVRDFLTYRAGLELNFNLGKEKAWALVVNPSFVWGDICNARLYKTHASFEVSAGLVYYFKTSNGTRSFTKARLYDQAEVDALNARIVELQNQAKTTNVVQQVVEKVVVNQESTYVVSFEKGSCVLTDEAKAILDKVPENAIVNIAGSTSPEGAKWFNEKLATNRALAVANYLKERGVKVDKAEGGASGRIAVVTFAK